MAAMIVSMEKPWWAYDKMKRMTGGTCRTIGRLTENMEARVNPPPPEEQKENFAD